jgi:excisionase family DNA binding protein
MPRRGCPTTRRRREAGRVSDLSRQRAAEKLGVSRSLVYRLVEQGEFPNAYQVSNRLLIPRADVDALRERKRVRSRRAPMYEPPKPSRARPTSGRAERVANALQRQNACKPAE